jgi:osmoprotectant transport system permease protein
VPQVRNRVLLVLLACAGAAIAATGFVSHAPNRLLSGRPVALWHAVPPAATVGIAALGACLLAACFLPQTRRLHLTAAALATALLLLLPYAAGEAASMLAASGSPAARTGLGAAFWTTALCAALAVVNAMQGLQAGPVARLLVSAALAGAVLAMLATGLLDGLSIMREYANRHDVFAAELRRHCALVVGALGPALAIGVPLGVVAARRPRVEGPLFAALNLMQTIPSIALFGLLIEPLSVLATAVPALGAIGVRGIGVAPAVVALVLYSLLPVARNVQAGLAGVDPAVIEAAAGMGFTSGQILRKVELPLALPVFLSGLRIVTVQAIGLAVVAALIGAGGLGSFVFQGLGQYALDLVLLGAVPAILLALAADIVLRSLADLARTRRRGGDGVP